MINCTSSKLKSSLVNELREQKAKSQRKYLLINHIINNGFLSKIFFNSQNSTGRKQTTEFKNEQRT